MWPARYWPDRYWGAYWPPLAGVTPQPAPVPVPTSGGSVGTGRHYRHETPRDRQRRRNRELRRHPDWPYVPPDWKPGDPIRKPVVALQPEPDLESEEPSALPVRLGYAEDPDGFVRSIEEASRRAVEKALARAEAARLAAEEARRAWEASIREPLAEADAIEAGIDEQAIDAAQAAWETEMAARLLLLVA